LNDTRLNFINLKCIDNNTASSAGVSFADLVISGYDRRLPVAIKMWSKDSSHATALEYEAEVYKVIDQILVKKYSPNFIRFIGYGCCQKENICLLLTERAGNGAMFGRFKDFPVRTLHEISLALQPDELEKIIFQIVFSLEVLNRFKINHNDLHTNNILVVDFIKPITMVFETNVRYLIKTRYVPYIYDWDNSYSFLCGPNPALKNHQFLFNTNDSRRDLYTVMCYLVGRNKFKPVPALVRYGKNKLFHQIEWQLPVMYLTNKESKLFQPNIVYKKSRAEFLDLIKDALLTKKRVLSGWRR
jgi:serine/threonine protein kinase